MKMEIWETQPQPGRWAGKKNQTAEDRECAWGQICAGCGGFYLPGKIPGDRSTWDVVAFTCREKSLVIGTGCGGLYLPGKFPGDRSTWDVGAFTCQEKSHFLSRLPLPRQGLMDRGEGGAVTPLAPHASIYLLYSEDPEPAPSAAPEMQLPTGGRWKNAAPSPSKFHRNLAEEAQIAPRTPGTPRGAVSPSGIITGRN